MTKERVEDVVLRLGTPIAEGLGYELVDVEYKKEGSDWVLRCFIDTPTGVGIDECQKYSESIEKILDVEDPISGSYLLEVSSPGIERPIKKESDYQRYVGQNVEVKLHKALDGQKKYVGQLVSFNDTDKAILVKTNEKIINVPLREVAKANLKIDDFFGAGGGKN